MADKELPTLEGSDASEDTKDAFRIWQPIIDFSNPWFSLKKNQLTGLELLAFWLLLFSRAAICWSTKCGPTSPSHSAQTYKEELLCQNIAF